MSTFILTGELYSKLLKYGSANLNVNRKIVNDLNVFPIPDGDTGDNMFMTIDSGVSSISKSQSVTIEAASDLAAKGMLLGARGNSGVILSRIFAGISKGFKGYKEADIRTISKAFEYGVEEAYNAVSKPVEGTILTVWKDAVTYANSKITDDTSLENYFADLSEETKKSLERTPELLDCLKEAGVVDSGGAGLFYIIEGVKNELDGNSSIDINSNTVSQYSQEKKQSIDISSFTKDSVLEFGYCTEFIMRLQSSKIDVNDFDEKILSDWLNENGDSLVFFRDDDLIKVHVHTMTPGNILNQCQKYGEFMTLKIENMMLQHNETTIQNNYDKQSVTLSKMPHKKYAVVTVANGSGIKKTFEEMGVDAVIDGGQSMNPSAQDFVDSFKKLNADTILVFPNNSNIIMAAKQAAELYKDSDVRVINAKTIGDGYAAISMLDTSSDDTEKIISECEEIISGVVTGMVSIAVHDANMNGIEVKKDDYIGFTGDTIHVKAKTMDEACISLAQKTDAGRYDVLLLIRGKDTPKENATKTCKELQEKYRRTEVILLDGEQPIYNYILIME